MGKGKGHSPSPLLFPKAKRDDACGIGFPPPILKAAPPFRFSFISLGSIQESKPIRALSYNTASGVLAISMDGRTTTRDAWTGRLLTTSESSVDEMMSTEFCPSLSGGFVSMGEHQLCMLPSWHVQASTVAPTLTLKDSEADARHQLLGGSKEDLALTNIIQVAYASHSEHQEEQGEGVDLGPPCFHRISIEQQDLDALATIVPKMDRLSMLRSLYPVDKCTNPLKQLRGMLFEKRNQVNEVIACSVNLEENLMVTAAELGFGAAPLGSTEYLQMKMGEHIQFTRLQCIHCGHIEAIASPLWKKHVCHTKGQQGWKAGALDQWMASSCVPLSETSCVAMHPSLPWIVVFDDTRYSMYSIRGCLYKLFPFAPRLETTPPIKTWYQRLPLIRSWHDRQWMAGNAKVYQKQQKKSESMWNKGCDHLKGKRVDAVLLRDKDALIAVEVWEEKHTVLRWSTALASDTEIGPLHAQDVLVLSEGAVVCTKPLGYTTLCVCFEKQLCVVEWQDELVVRNTWELGTKAHGMEVVSNHIVGILTQTGVRMMDILSGAPLGNLCLSSPPTALTVMDSGETLCVGDASGCVHAFRCTARGPASCILRKVAEHPLHGLVALDARGGLIPTTAPDGILSWKGSTMLSTSIALKVHVDSGVGRLIVGWTGLCIPSVVEIWSPRACGTQSMWADAMVSPGECILRCEMKDVLLSKKDYEVLFPGSSFPAAQHVATLLLDAPYCESTLVVRIHLSKEEQVGLGNVHLRVAPFEKVDEEWPQRLIHQLEQGKDHQAALDAAVVALWYGNQEWKDEDIQHVLHVATAESLPSEAWSRFVTLIVARQSKGDAIASNVSKVLDQVTKQLGEKATPAQCMQLLRLYDIAGKVDTPVEKDTSRAVRGAALWCSESPDLVPTKSWRCYFAVLAHLLESPTYCSMIMKCKQHQDFLMAAVRGIALKSKASNAVLSLFELVQQETHEKQPKEWIMQWVKCLLAPVVEECTTSQQTSLVTGGFAKGTGYSSDSSTGSVWTGNNPRQRIVWPSLGRIVEMLEPKDWEESLLETVLCLPLQTDSPVELFGDHALPLLHAVLTTIGKMEHIPNSAAELVQARFKQSKMFATMMKTPEVKPVLELLHQCASRVHVPDKKKVEEEEKTYATILRPFQWQSVSLGGEKRSMEKKGLLRLMQEFSTLCTCLPLHADSSVFVRTDEEDCTHAKVMIVGPFDTPYAGGCFVLDVVFPSNYPGSPPKVTLLTTGNSTIRFGPNLYNCGKVCLSLLGTWSGGEGETWLGSTSTFLQVLVSIQSLVFCEEPYFQEPGWQHERGSEAGTKKNAAYSRCIQAATLHFAIRQALENPDPVFADAIRAHFYADRERLLKMIRQWTSDVEAEEATGSLAQYSHSCQGNPQPSSQKMKEDVKAVEKLLKALSEPVPPPEEESDEESSDEEDD